jgi:small subunit ribosomal protein S4
VNIPSYLVQPGDVVAVRPSSRSTPVFKEVALDLQHRAVPEWLTRDDLSMSGRVMSQPERGDIDVTINEQLIVEYYSR